MTADTQDGRSEPATLPSANASDVRLNRPEETCEVLAMAVQPPRAASPLVPVITIGGGSSDTEQAPTAVCDTDSKTSCDTVDLVIGEQTEDETRCMDLFPKYLDCQETLIELSFIKWLNGFRTECRTMSSGINKNIFYGLLNFFSVNLGPEIVECRNKINRSTLLESYLEPTLMFFRKCHKTIQEPLNDVYYDRICLMLAYYFDLKIMACHRHADDKAWLRKTSSKISVGLHLYLDEKFDYMIDTIFQMYYTFYGASTINGTLTALILPVIKKLLAERSIPKTMNVLTFLRYILCFKLWKKTIYSSSLPSFDKRKEADQIRILVRGLNTPSEIMSDLQKYNWPNWPKLKSSYEKPNDRELKNIPMILYNANFPIKNAFKDMHDFSRKDVPRLLAMVEEQCKILRSDLFSVTSKEVKNSWNLYFDTKIAPRISSTRSCNSLLRQFKYNLHSDLLEKLPEQKKTVNELTNLTSFDLNNSHNPDPNMLKQSSENSESHYPQFIENISSHNNSIEVNTINTKDDHLNEVNSNMIEENNQSNNEQIPGMFNNTHHSNNAECSNTSNKRIKRSHPMSSDFEISKKSCNLETKKETNLTNDNINNSIYSDCQDPNNENISHLNLNNDNLSSINSKNIKEQDISKVSPLIDMSTVEKNKLERKSLYSELSVTSVSNSKCSQSNLSDEDKNIDHLLSINNSEEATSKLVSSKQTINENENLQIYALPMDQKLTHVEHSYIEKTTNLATLDLEVVNVLSPISINSSDISMSKSSWVPDIMLAHEVNGFDSDHSQATLQQLNGLGNSIDSNTNLSSNQHDEVKNINLIPLESPTISKLSSCNQIEPRMYPDDLYTSDLTSDESSVLNSAYSSYDLNQAYTVAPIKSIPVSVSSKNTSHELNDLTHSSYCEKPISPSLNELKANFAAESNSTYSLAMNKTKTSSIDTLCSVKHVVESQSQYNNNKTKSPDVVFDAFSDVDYTDLRIYGLEPKEINSCTIPSDLKSVNMYSNFDNENNSSNFNQQQNLKLYTDPKELISEPVNLLKQPETQVNINEPHAQKVFLGIQSPTQVYYSPTADFCVSSDEMSNIEDNKQSSFKNKPITTDNLNTCSNDKYINTGLQPIDESTSFKQTLICDYDDVNQNLPIVNNGLIYNPSIVFQNSLPLQHKSLGCLLSPHNGLTYANFDQVPGSSSQENKKQKEKLPVINMAHLMVQTNKNCKVHYKWPLNKNISPSTASSEIVHEIPQSKKKSNVLYVQYTDDELNKTQLQNISPNEFANQNSDLSSNEIKEDTTSYQSSQQFQDKPNLTMSNVSATVQSGSDSTDENGQTQSRAIISKSRKEPTIHQELISKNANIRSQSPETLSALSREVFEAARYLFNESSLFLCMYPKCKNSHHFRVLPSNAEMLSHEFTVPFDDFRFNIQYNFKRIIESSHLKTWPSLPKLETLTKRCSCEICVDLELKMNKNQEMLHSYVETKNNEYNNENDELTDQQIRLSSWKKNLANRFSSEDDAKQTIVQLLVDMKRHVNRFNHAFTIIFGLSKDVKLNLQNLKNACESYTNVNNRPTNSKSIEKLDIAHTFFYEDLLLYSYQYYLQIPIVIPKDVLEDLANSSYQASNSSQEHSSNDMIRYLIENSLSPSSQTVNSNLTRLILKYIKENVTNSSHQLAVEKSSSTSRQSSITNLTISPEPISNSHASSSHGISLDSSSLPNNVVNKHDMVYYYSDGQKYTDLPNTYLQVPRAQSSDNSVPFSPSLSIPNSPSSDCSIPSLVETVATAVPEHALMDDSLEAVNAAHNLLLISNRHRYNNTTSFASKNTIDTVTVTTMATTNVKTVKKTYISVTETKAAAHISPNINDISLPQTSNYNIITTDAAINVQPMIEPEDEEMDIVYSSRKKKKKKHDKKRDKKKKEKR